MSQWHESARRAGCPRPRQLADDLGVCPVGAASGEEGTAGACTAGHQAIWVDDWLWVGYDYCGLH